METIVRSKRSTLPPPYNPPELTNLMRIRGLRREATRRRPGSDDPRLRESARVATVSPMKPAYGYSGAAYSCRPPKVTHYGPMSSSAFPRCNLLSVASLVRPTGAAMGSAAAQSPRLQLCYQRRACRHRRYGEVIIR